MVLTASHIHSLFLQDSLAQQTYIRGLNVKLVVMLFYDELHKSLFRVDYKYSKLRYVEKLEHQIFSRPQEHP